MKYNKKNAIFWGVLCLLPCIVFCIGGEIVFRIYYFIRHASRQTNSQAIILDERLGWRNTPNYQFQKDLKDAVGENYRVEKQTDERGFLVFGNPKSHSPKIMVLGDSFTHAQAVSNTKAYYGLLQQQLGEFFVYGTSGYGTLQEFMIAEQYFHEIQPDAIILQFCSNDFVNNSYELERRSSSNNSRKRRPYFVLDGMIVYATPLSAFVRAREFIGKYSRFLNSILWRIDRLYAEIDKTETVERNIEQQGESFEFFQEAVVITDRILRAVRSFVPQSIPIYAFSADDGFPYESIFKRLSRKNNIHFIDGIPEAIRTAEKRGIITRAADMHHWNEEGHAIVAHTLREYFQHQSSQLK